MIPTVVRLERERRATARENRAWALAETLARSPIVQMVGSVLLAEWAEKQGLLSHRWAGALEGGVIAMVGVQAYKELGLVGSAAILGGMGAGGAAGQLGTESRPEQALDLALLGINPTAGVVNLLTK